MAIRRIRNAYVETDYFPEKEFIIPSEGMVVIVRDESPEKHGLIEIPESAKREALTGHIACVGEGIYFYQPNDYVHFGQYAGSKVELHSVLRLKGLIYDYMSVKDLRGIIYTEENETKTT